MKYLSKLVLIILFTDKLYSQGCCSGGAGSPIAGGVSQGVLKSKQIEIGANYQYRASNRFFVEDRDTVKLFDKLSSNFFYLKIAYGLTKELTLSVESGYYLDKTMIGLNKVDTIKSSGISDLIIFPRYNVYNKKKERYRTEATIGIGLKIPLGMHDDSTVVYTNPTTGKKYYTTSPPTVQPTSGSNDFIFYGFLFREYPYKSFRIFTNLMYIKKGWNSLGQKFGDYASVGLFASKSITKKLGIVLQLKGEWVDMMQYDKNVDMLALYNIDVKSTGSRSIFLVPQISFTHENFTIFGLSEIPLYQYLSGTQVGSQNHALIGVSFRFNNKACETPISADEKNKQ